MTQVSFLKTKLILLVLSATMAAGQNAPAKEADAEREEIRGRKAWIMCTAIPEEVPNPVSVLSDGELHEITLSLRNMSDPFPIGGDGTVHLVKQEIDEARPGKLALKPLAKATVPKEVSQALIIMVPAPEGHEHAFRTKIVDLNQFRGGDYMYLNLSPRKIVVHLGEEKTPLSPGTLHIQENREIRNATNTPLSFHYFSESQQKWKLITATTVVVQPTRREICVFGWDGENQRVSFKGATFPIEVP